MSPSVCVTDFDDTLISLDSFVHIFRKERLFLEPRAFVWSVLAFMAMWTLPRAWQLPIRKRAKFYALRSAERYGLDRIVTKYLPFFLTRLNQSVIGEIKNKYSHVVVATGSWQPLAEKILRAATINWPVIGAVLAPELKDFQFNWYTEKKNNVDKLQLGAFDFYTDSLDDLPLLTTATNAFIVSNGVITKYEKHI